MRSVPTIYKVAFDVSLHGDDEVRSRLVQWYEEKGAQAVRLVSHPLTPKYVIDQIIESFDLKNPYDRKAFGELLSLPQFSEEELRKIHQDNNWKLFGEKRQYAHILQNPNCPQDLIPELLESGENDLVRFVVDSPHVTIELLVQIAENHPAYYTKGSAVAHKKFPEDELVKYLARQERVVLMHPNLSDESILANWHMLKEKPIAMKRLATRDNLSSVVVRKMVQHLTTNVAGWHYSSMQKVIYALLQTGLTTPKETQQLLDINPHDREARAHARTAMSEDLMYQIHHESTWRYAEVLAHPRATEEHQIAAYRKFAEYLLTSNSDEAHLTYAGDLCKLLAHEGVALSPEMYLKFATLVKESTPYAATLHSLTTDPQQMIELMPEPGKQGAGSFLAQCIEILENPYFPNSLIPFLINMTHEHREEPKMQTYFERIDQILEFREMFLTGENAVSHEVLDRLMHRET